MRLFFDHKKSPPKPPTVSGPSVEAIKQDTHDKIQQAEDAAKGLNTLLRANGITLNISIATGGHTRGK